MKLMDVRDIVNQRIESSHFIPGTIVIDKGNGKLREWSEDREMKKIEPVGMFGEKLIR
jgi:hypothetical protein